MTWSGDRFRADDGDLRRFSAAGDAHVRNLTSVLDRVRSARRSVVVALDHAIVPDADLAFQRLVTAAVASNRQARSVERSLVDHRPGPSLAIGGPSGLVGSGVDLVTGLPELAPTIGEVGSGLGLASRPLDEARRTIGETVRAGADRLDDLIVDAIPYAAAAPELGGRLLLGPRYRDAARIVNHHLTPLGVTALLAGLDRIVVDRSTTGDPRGTFTSRPTGLRRSAPRGGPSQQGRQAIIGALADTADAERLYQDEFQLIAHESGAYTIVLAGVTDLSNPRAGLAPGHRSVRDTDVVAARSAASAAVADNAYAAIVIEALDRLGLPSGADLMIVGHSQGADTALDLAADSDFNGRRYDVTHVVAAGYHSEPQLAHVQPETSVLVLQNNKDLPVLFENLGHVALDPFEEFVSPPEHVILREFDGGWRGAGHHQDNYLSYLAEHDDDELADYFTAVAGAGYATLGWAQAIDISLPDTGQPIEGHPRKVQAAGTTASGRGCTSLSAGERPDPAVLRGQHRGQPPELDGTGR